MLNKATTVPDQDHIESLTRMRQAHGSYNKSSPSRYTPEGLG